MHSARDNKFRMIAAIHKTNQNSLTVVYGDTLGLIALINYQNAHSPNKRKWDDDDKMSN